MKLHVRRFSDTGGGSGSGGNPVDPPGEPQQPPQPAPYPPPPPAPPSEPPPYQPPSYQPAPPAPAYQPPPPAPPPPAPAPPYQPPSAPPAYGAPPGYGAAPAYGAPPAYAPPQQQQQQPYYGPPAMPPGFAPPPARGGRSRTLMIVGIVAAVLVVVLAAGAFLANASLSSTYSPGKAVSDYFAAQTRGDSAYMWANANYIKGDGAQDSLFDESAVAAMVAVKENQAISGVTVTSTTQLDSTTDKVAVSMTWNSNQVSETYTVHKDRSRAHFVFYNDWKIDIPSSTISLTLPNQAGAISVDGIAVSSTSSVSVIQGYHAVTMAQSDFYDADDESVNAIDPAASATFKSAMSSAAVSAAAGAIKISFQPANITCDPNKYFDCPNHRYSPPAGEYDLLPMPGGDVRANSSWVLTLTGDPTKDMKLVVGTTKGEIAASGTCSSTLTVDGSRKYNYTGTWTGTLKWTGSDFGYDGTFSCDDSKA